MGLKLSYEESSRAPGAGRITRDLGTNTTRVSKELGPIYSFINRISSYSTIVGFSWPAAPSHMFSVVVQTQDLILLTLADGLTVG